MTKIKIWLRYLILQATFLFFISTAISQTSSKYLIIVSSKKTYRVSKGNDFYCQVKLINKGYLKITLPFLNSASNDTTLKIIHTDYKISFLKDGSTIFKVIKDGPFMRPGEVGKEISFSTYQKNISIYTPNLFISEKGRYKIKFTISYYKNKEKKLYEATSNWINIIVS